MVDIQKHFEKMAHEYDSVIGQIAPYYSNMLDSVLLSLPFKSADNIRIVELGCGTGNLTEKVSREYPEANILAVDIAKEMIEIAQNRFKGNSHIQFNQSDMCGFPFGQDINAVLSTLVLHHIRDDQSKKDLYKTICQSLLADGVFIIGDIVLGETDHIEKINTNKWVEYMERTVPTEEIQNKWVPRHYETDRPCTLMDELQWLKEAGFKQTFVVWKYFNLVVYGGIK